MRSLIVLFFLTAQLIGNCYSAVIWSWEFANPVISTSPLEDVSVFITITNHTNSTEGINATAFFSPFDDKETWGEYNGVIFNENFEFVYTPLFMGGQIIINPGESVSLQILEMYASGAAKEGDIYTLNPTLYLFVEDPDLSLLSKAKASVPLNIQISEVPLPSALFLFLPSLFFLVSAKFRLR
jgi:hypothetical protein